MQLYIKRDNDLNLKQNTDLPANIVLANPRGFCAGVDRAIIIVEQALEKFGAPIYVLYDLFVSPKARKSGLGKMLLEQAREHAQANGIPRMDLTTAKTNFNAQSLYESLGWVRDDIFYAYNKSV